jgi:hypothetical protein
MHSLYYLPEEKGLLERYIQTLKVIITTHFTLINRGKIINYVCFSLISLESIEITYNYKISTKG